MALSELFRIINESTISNPFDIFKLRPIFLKSLNECRDQNIFIDSSYMQNYSVGFLGSKYMKTFTNNISIDGINVSSENIGGYEAAINILGPEYNHYLVCFKLKFYIKNDNLNDIIELISDVDPRINNYTLYNIAKDSNNVNIINMILYKILYLNWLEQQIFAQHLGDNTPHQELFNYMKQLQK